MLKLYLIKRSDKCGYDQYDSAVVVAQSSNKAKLIHPGGYDKWNGTCGEYDSWVPAEEVIVKFIGTASKELKAGKVVCSSFNAG